MFGAVLDSRYCQGTLRSAGGPMRILVTGGAGYIGSCCLRFLLAEGHDIGVFDNLETGHADALPDGVPLIRGDLRVPAEIDAALGQDSFDAVMHFGAYIDVAESVREPARYYLNNVIGGLNLLEAMRRHRCQRIVFSSTAATYGAPQEIPITETAPTCPTNPYGETKLAFEKALEWYGQAYGLRWVALRYFNACGALSGCGERHSPEIHLIPNLLRAALGDAPAVRIFGTDYETRDGTAVRDYVHVADLARAHLLALQQLERGSARYNLGHGVGYTVREVLQAAREVTGQPIPATEEPRRPGDPPVLIASADKIRQEWDWHPVDSSLESIIGSAWEWHRQHGVGESRASSGRKCGN